MSETDKPRLAIIGTGLSALACADGLADDYAISLFDKSRGLSGRLSTRRAEGFAFDHGAQYFHADNAAFADWLKPFEAAGHVGSWTPRHVQFAADGACHMCADAASKWVFTPSMNAVGKALIARRQQWAVHLDCAIDAVTGKAGAWVLQAGEQVFGPFEHVVSAVPPQQALALLPEGVGFADALAKTQMMGCHALMLGYRADEAPEMDWDCAHFDDEVLGFAAVNSTKPGRGGGFALVVQTQHDWSQTHMEDAPENVGAIMKARFQALTGCPTVASGYDRVHRWRYASTHQAAAGSAQPYLWDGEKRLSATGDWCNGSKAEHAFLSGMALATKLRGLVSSALQPGQSPA